MCDINVHIGPPMTIYSYLYEQGLVPSAQRTTNWNGVGGVCCLEVRQINVAHCKGQHQSIDYYKQLLVVCLCFYVQFCLKKSATTCKEDECYSVCPMCPMSV
jgi:hypothetical protein